MKQQIFCDLNIHLTLHTTAKGLRKADLNLKRSGGLTWEFVESDCQHWNHSVSDWLEAYALGKKQPTLNLDLEAYTPFTQEVWAILRAIPKGKWLSYGEVAAKMNKPNASRAVGAACGRNPMLLFIPCHRVLQGSGSLGGFSCGLPLKKLLLDHEGVSYRGA